MVAKRILTFILLAGAAAASLWWFDHSGDHELVVANPINNVPSGVTNLYFVPDVQSAVQSIKNQESYDASFPEMKWLRTLVERDTSAQSWLFERGAVIAQGNEKGILIGTPEDWRQQETESWLVSHLGAQPVQSGKLKIGQLSLTLRNQGIYISQDPLSEDFLSPHPDPNYWNNLVHRGSQSHILQITSGKSDFTPFLGASDSTLFVRDYQFQNQLLTVEEMLYPETESIQTEPIPSDWTDFLPSDAKKVIALGFVSGYDVRPFLQKKLEKENRLAAFNDSLAVAESRQGISAEGYFSDWWSDGVLRFESKGNKYLLLGCLNPKLAIASFETEEEFQRQNLSGGTVISWEKEGVFQHFLSTLCGVEAKAVWTQGKTIVVAENLTDLVNLIARLKTGDTLASDHIIATCLNRKEHILHYHQFEQTDQSTFHAFTVPVFAVEDGKSSHLIRSGARTANGVWVTRIDVSPAPKITRSVSLKWQRTLDFEILGKVGSVKNHKNGEYYSLMQDKAYTVHALDARGKEMWSIELGEPVTSDFFALDLYQNGKYQVAFSTSNKVYCLDVKGRNVDGYPIAAPEGTNISCPLYIADYDNNRNYRLLIGLSDGRILNYRKEGEQTPGWRYKGNESVQHIEHIKAGNKDYVFAALGNGSIRLLKRNGEDRFKSNTNIGTDINQLDFRMTNDIAESSVIIHRSSNEIAAFKFGGTNTKGQVLATGNAFILADLGNDRTQELVVLDNNWVRAYAAGGALLFERAFSENLSPELNAYQFTSGQKPGVVAPEASEFYLIEKDGSSAIGFPLFGVTKGIIRDFNADGRLEMITTDGRSLMLCYGM